ncbi:MAG TPA: response regulator [Verrucomicrobiae bacterium]|nr:response regulator [Verrucomicrobiae bacterium]
MHINKLEILLIEDSEDDVFFVEKAVKDSQSVHSLHTVSNGLEAIKYLKGEPPFDDRKKYPRPNVILCDLKMPGMNGFDFLSWVQSRPDCKVIPIMVYSSSSLESDVWKAYELGAHAYFVKPAHMKELLDFLQSAFEFWSRCECPTPPRPS